MQSNRREVLTQAGSFLVASTVTGSALAGTNFAPLKLRLLETSDLHMFAMDWDYYHAMPDATVGLNKIASLIATARAEAKNSLLFDNGDIIQGSPLGDYVAQKLALKRGDVHPMFMAMNRLGYDAATVGNHEFNFGLDFMDVALGGANFPFVCANLFKADGSSYFPLYKVLERNFTDEAGAPQKLRIGVIGFVPPQILIWDKARLEGKVQTLDIIASAQKYVPELRGQCDLLLALCHSGISTMEPVEGGENMSFHLSKVAGIDVIFTGHSHRVFPGPDYSAREGIDAVRGTLNGVPAVMPGFWGSHLGQIDLTLTRQSDKWTVADFSVQAKPIYRRDKDGVTPLVRADAALSASVAEAHQAALAWVEEPVGTLAKRAHSYFVWVGHDPASNIVNAAQIWYAAQYFKNTPFAVLPILSAAAPFRAGYKPDYYIDIAAGEIPLRAVADLYIYPNGLTAVKITGADVREWLEHACRTFNTIDPKNTNLQPLIEPRVPSYNFDQIAGVAYQIDLSQPARYDSEGKVINPQAHRIVNLIYQGKPIDLAQDFIVITNNYRADGGGKFPGLGSAKVIWRAPDTNRDAVQHYIHAQKSVDFALQAPWTFAPIGTKVSLSFDSAVAASALVGEVPGLRLIGNGQPGYNSYAIELV